MKFFYKFLLMNEGIFFCFAFIFHHKNKKRA